MTGLVTGFVTGLVTGSTSVAVEAAEWKHRSLQAERSRPGATAATEVAACGDAAGAAVLLWPHDSKPCGSRLCGSERTGLGVVALAVPGLADRGAGMSGGESGSVVGEGSRSCGDEDMSPTDAGGSAADARAASALQSPLLLLLLTPLVAPPSPP